MNINTKQPKIKILFSRGVWIFILIFLFGFLAGLISGNQLQLEKNYLMIIGGILFAFILLSYIFIQILLKREAEINQQTEILAVTDEATQLFNREYFYGLFKNELSRAARYKKNFSCVLLSIDNFNDINNEYGFQFINKILQDVAETLKDNTRLSDILGRYDTNKFICLLPETEIESANIWGKRLRSLVEGEKYYPMDNTRAMHIPILIVICIALVLPDG